MSGLLTFQTVRNVVDDDDADDSKRQRLVQLRLTLKLISEQYW